MQLDCVFAGDLCQREAKSAEREAEVEDEGALTCDDVRTMQPGIIIVLKLTLGGCETFGLPLLAEPKLINRWLPVALGLPLAGALQVDVA